MIRNYENYFVAAGILLLYASGLWAQQEANGVLSADQTNRPHVAQDSLSVKNPTGAMLRSLAVPGWGQFYNGKWFKGILVAGAETGLVANALVLDQWAKNSATENERLYYLDNRNLSF